MMDNADIFCEYLRALEVPHTRWYSRSQFASMTFHSLFGLSKLLESYGVPNEAYTFADKATDLPKLSTPFMAEMTDGSFVIVESTSANAVGYKGPESATLTPADFCNRWNGVALLAFPSPKASEPQYSSHRFTEIGNAAKPWVLGGALLFIFVYLCVSSGVFANVSTALLLLIDLGGLFVTWQLVLKSLNIHTRAADRICGVIDRSGCHTVLNTSAAKFFGIFGWSEVGLAYFGVSLGTLLLFPEHLPQLALINALCCPFSIWSVWYQKYRAKAWCTLCLITQACLWLSLACYVAGGWFRGAWPLNASFFALGAAYVAALLIINRISPKYTRSDG